MRAAAAPRTRAPARQAYSPRQRALLVFTLTALAGTVYSVLNVSSAATAFRSRLPAHTLTKITESNTAFPVQLSLPFFADKVRLLLPDLLLRRGERDSQT